VDALAPHVFVALCMVAVSATQCPQTPHSGALNKVIIDNAFFSLSS